MKNFLLTAAAILFTFSSFSQINMTQLGYLDLQTLHGSDLNDIWGYTDEDGNEYAIVGLNDGVSVVDVTDPANPVEIEYFNGMNSIWRDIKVWGDYAYVTTEATQGLEIIDLTPLPLSTAITSTTYTGPTGNQWQSAHNIYIDNGLAYIFGANRDNGGVIILDVNTTPGTPIEVGTFDEWYCHDGYVQNDTGYFSHINDGFFSIVDLDGLGTLGLTDVIGSLPTSSVFTHNCWTSDDGQILFTTDEKENGFIDSYDISDPSSPILLDQIQSSPGNNIIPHNTHVKGNYTITSYYTDGVVVHDVSDPANMVEVANFDTSPAFSGNTFNGCWGVYPYFASNNLIASDIENGLYILSIASTLSSYLQGVVTNAGNGQPINNALVEILTTAVVDNSDVLGDYSIGLPNSGNYDVRFSAPGFYDDTINVDFVVGQVVTENVALVQIPLFSSTITVLDGDSGSPVEGASVKIDHTLQSFEGLTDVNGEVTFELFYEDNYDLNAGKWLYKTTCISPQMLTITDNDVTVEIFEGIYDDFTFDFGWTTTTLADDGFWVREVPVGTSAAGENPNPFTDASTDCSDLCYITGNGASSVGGDDVDGGSVELHSPIFDITPFYNPEIKFSYWFYNGFGGGTPNDEYEIRLSNGTDEVQIELLDLGNATVSEWTEFNIKVRDFMVPTATMELILIAADDNPGHVMKAGVDHFRVEEGSTVELVESASKLYLYPNPATDEIRIAGLSEVVNVTITDLSGKIVSNSTTQSLINVSHLSNGLYIVEVRDLEGHLLMIEKQEVR
jgi:choice-of-anchor B domain-containing protein